MIEWDSKKSPLIKVGRLDIPQQSGIHSKERQEFCENISMNPWRAPLENRPLGAANRTRLEVYSKQVEFRHMYNGVKDPNPKSFKKMP